MFWVIRSRPFFYIRNPFWRKKGVFDLAVNGWLLHCHRKNNISYIIGRKSRSRIVWLWAGFFCLMLLIRCLICPDLWVSVVGAHALSMSTCNSPRRNITIYAGVSFWTTTNILETFVFIPDYYLSRIVTATIRERMSVWSPTRMQRYHSLISGYPWPMDVCKQCIRFSYAERQFDIDAANFAAKEQSQFDTTAIWKRIL